MLMKCWTLRALKCHSETNDLSCTPLSGFGSQSAQLVAFAIDGFAAGCRVVVSEEGFVKDVTCTCAKSRFGAQSAQLAVFVSDDFAAGCPIVASAEDFIKDVTCTWARSRFGGQSADVVVILIEHFGAGCRLVVFATASLRAFVWSCGRSL